MTINFEEAYAIAEENLEKMEKQAYRFEKLFYYLLKRGCKHEVVKKCRTNRIE